MEMHRLHSLFCKFMALLKWDLVMTNMHMFTPEQGYLIYCRLHVLDSLHIYPLIWEYDTLF